MKKISSLIVASIFVASLAGIGCSNGSDGSTIGLVLVNNEKKQSASEKVDAGRNTCAAAQVKLNSLADGAEFDLDNYVFTENDVLKVTKPVTLRNGKFGQGSVSVACDGVKLINLTEVSVMVTKDAGDLVMTGCSVNGLVYESSTGARAVTSKSLVANDSSIGVLSNNFEGLKIILAGKSIVTDTLLKVSTVLNSSNKESNFGKIKIGKKGTASNVKVILKGFAKADSVIAVTGTDVELKVASKDVLISKRDENIVPKVADVSDLEDGEFITISADVFDKWEILSADDLKALLDKVDEFIDRLETFFKTFDSDSEKADSAVSDYSKLIEDAKDELEAAKVNNNFYGKRFYVSKLEKEDGSSVFELTEEQLELVKDSAPYFEFTENRIDSPYFEKFFETYGVTGDMHYQINELQGFSVSKQSTDKLMIGLMEIVSSKIFRNKAEANVVIKRLVNKGGAFEEQSTDKYKIHLLDLDKSHLLNDMKFLTEEQRKAVTILNRLTYLDGKDYIDYVTKNWSEVQNLEAYINSLTSLTPEQIYDILETYPGIKNIFHKESSGYLPTWANPLATVKLYYVTDFGVSSPVDALLLSLETMLGNGSFKVYLERECINQISLSKVPEKVSSGEIKAIYAKISSGISIPGFDGIKDSFSVMYSGLKICEYPISDADSLILFLVEDIDYTLNGTIMYLTDTGYGKLKDNWDRLVNPKKD